MFVVMTVLTVLKVPFEKAAPPCLSDVPAPLNRPTHVPGKEKAPTIWDFFA